MKEAFLIAIIFVSVTLGCVSKKQISGNYVSGGSAYWFTNSPNEFEYFIKGEMGLLFYSKGSWFKVKDSLFLNGFNDKNVRISDFESNLSAINEISDTLTQVRYYSSCNCKEIKADLLINGKERFSELVDTVINIREIVHSIQLFSYISSTDLFSNAPSQDTLRSPVVNFDITSKRNILNITNPISWKDFVRRTHSDTLRVINSRLLKDGKIEFRLDQLK